MRDGKPFQSVGNVNPIRRPTLQAGLLGAGPLGRTAVGALLGVAPALHFLREAPEDHLARGCLKNRRYLGRDGLADHPARIVHDHHSPVIQVGNALVVLFALLEDEDLHGLTGQDNRFESVRQLVDVQYFNTAQLGNLVEIEVVGNDLRPQLFCQLDQLQVDFFYVGVVLLDDLDGDPRAPT